VKLLIPTLKCILLLTTLWKFEIIKKNELCKQHGSQCVAIVTMKKNKIFILSLLITITASSALKAQEEEHYMPILTDNMGWHTKYNFSKVKTTQCKDTLWRVSTRNRLRFRLRK